MRPSRRAERGDAGQAFARQSQRAPPNSRHVRAGEDCVLLDKRDVGTGSTAASTSLLQHEIDTELADLIDRVGEADAVRAYQLGIEAIDRVEELLMRLGDGCRFTRRSSLLPGEQEIPRPEAQTRV